MRNKTMLSFMAATTLLLSGCGASGTQSGNDAAPEEDFPTSELQEYFSFDVEFDENTDWEAEAKEQDRIREEAIVTCMAEQGFTYTRNESRTFVQYGESDENLSERERLEQFGFGFFSEDGGIAGGGVAFEDANKEALDKMSDSEKSAWTTALYGADYENMTEEEMENFDWSAPENQGCQGIGDEAWRKSQSDAGQTNPYDVLYNDPQWADLAQAQMDLDMSINEDPEMVSLNNEWASCMADAGQTGLKSQEDIWDKLNEFNTQLYGDGSAETDPETASLEVSATEPTPADPALLKKAQETERALAVADYDCRQKLGYDLKAQEIRVKRENQFVDEHRAELEAFAAAVSGSTK